MRFENCIAMVAGLMVAACSQSPQVALDYPLPAFPVANDQATSNPALSRPTDTVGYRPYVASAPATTIPYQPVPTTSQQGPIDLLHGHFASAARSAPAAAAAAPATRVGLHEEQVASLPPAKSVRSPTPSVSPAANTATAKAAPAKPATPPPPPPKWQAHEGEPLREALDRLAAIAGYRVVWGYDQVPGLPLPRLTKEYASNGDFPHVVADLVTAARPTPYVLVYAGPHAGGHVVVVSPYKVGVLP